MPASILASLVLLPCSTSAQEFASNHLILSILLIGIVVSDWMIGFIFDATGLKPEPVKWIIRILLLSCYVLYVAVIAWEFACLTLPFLSH